MNKEDCTIIITEIFSKFKVDLLNQFEKIVQKN